MCLAIKAVFDSSMSCVPSSRDRYRRSRWALRCSTSATAFRCSTVAPPAGSAAASDGCATSFAATPATATKVSCRQRKSSTCEHTACPAQSRGTECAPLFDTVLAVLNACRLTGSSLKICSFSARTSTPSAAMSAAAPANRTQVYVSPDNDPGNFWRLVYEKEAPSETHRRAQPCSMQNVCNKMSAAMTKITTAVAGQGLEGGQRRCQQRGVRRGAVAAAHQPQQRRHRPGRRDRDGAAAGCR